MEKQKRKNQELLPVLDEVVFEFVLCVFRDFVHITVLLILNCNIDRCCQSTIEDFVQQCSKKDLKYIENRTVSIENRAVSIENHAVRLAYRLKNLLKGLLQSGHGGLGIVLCFGHAKCESENVSTYNLELSDTKKTNKTKNFTIVLAVFMFCLQFVSLQLNWTLNQLGANRVFLEIEISNSSVCLYHEIDTASEVQYYTMNGLSFVHFPRVINSRIGKQVDTHKLVHEHMRSLNAALKISYHTVLVSNSTATGTLFSLEEKLLSRFVTFVYRLFFYTVVLAAAPLLVRSSPLNDEALFKETKQRERRSTTPRSFVVDLKGAPNTGYCADMSFGSSVSTTQEFCMLVDTGSSNLAVAAAPLPEVREHLDTQVVDSSLVMTHQDVTVSYSGGEWSGTLASEMVSIGGSPLVEAKFALIESASTFFIPGAEWVGILGLAYDSLAKPDSSVTPFWSTLQKSSGLPDMFAIRICPPLDSVSKGGILEFGDISETLYTGPILYTSIVQELYYNVLVTSLTVGSVSVDLPCHQFNNDKAIVDSGTTDIYLPTETFAAVVSIFQAELKEGMPLEVPEDFWIGGLKISWPSESVDILFEAFPTFFIGLPKDGDSSNEFGLAVTPQTYLRQVSGSHEEMIEAKCSPHCSFFVFGIKSREKGLVIGGNVMLGFTTVFDRERQRIGFAKSTCNYIDDTPGHIPYIVGPYSRAPVDCECHGCSYSPAYWELIVYICGAIVSVLCLISTVHTFGIKCYKKRHRIADCCRRGFHRQNNYSARNVVATEDSESVSVSLERQVSVQSEDSGFGSANTSPCASGYSVVPQVTIVNCVEEQSSSTARSVSYSSPSATDTCVNDVDIALLTKPRNVVHTLVPHLATIVLFSC